MNDAPRDIRGLMMTVTNGRVLLPNANVSEIITAATPDPVENAPEWLLGRVRWRGWRVPLFSFSLLAEIAQKEASMTAKVTVLKAPGRRSEHAVHRDAVPGIPAPDDGDARRAAADRPGRGQDSRRLGRVLLRDDQASSPTCSRSSSAFPTHWPPDRRG